jgi:hypothetical protein
MNRPTFGEEYKPQCPSSTIILRRRRGRRRRMRRWRRKRRNVRDSSQFTSVSTLSSKC